MGLLNNFQVETGTGHIRINKFGKSTNVDSAVDTDLWDLTSQAVWLAPTAARIHAIVSADDTDTAGLGTLTIGTNPSNTNTVTIGLKVYTFQTTLTDVDGNVKIGAATTNSIDNLIAAINLAAGAGSTYATSMTANAVSTVAAVGAGDTMRLFDQASTAAATTDTLGDGSWGAGNTVSGASARTIRVTGLKTWALKESTEDVILHGTDAVNTINSYVIIHRMHVLTSGATSRNAGIIKATAATDSTITAQITATCGQTKMAIYGVPSGYTFQMTMYYGSVIKSAAALRLEFNLLVNIEPEDQITYNAEHDYGIDTTGDSLFSHLFQLPNEIPGPCIVKLSANSTAANTTVIGGFCGIVTQNAILDRTH